MNLMHQSYLYFVLTLATLLGYWISDNPAAVPVAVGFLVIAHVYRVAAHFEQRKQL